MLLSTLFAIVCVIRIETNIAIKVTFLIPFPYILKILLTVVYASFTKTVIN